MTLQNHFSSGLTTVCRAWAVQRFDGVTLGFTDHDRDLSFEGIAFAADTGLSARVIEQSTGLAVNNSEALGVLSAASINENDIRAGRYDGAEVRFWQVNWADPTQRILRFAGTIGEIRRKGSEFHAELRGLTEALNRPQGRVFQRDCPALLGDKQCGVNLDDPRFSFRAQAVSIKGPVLHFAANADSVAAGFVPGWFDNGRIDVQSGAAQNLSGIIKRDTFGPDNIRIIELWEELTVPLENAVIRVSAGCDKRMDTCRLKFNNMLNFQGFPDIPGDDWLGATPQGMLTDGGSLR